MLKVDTYFLEVVDLSAYHCFCPLPIPLHIPYTKRCDTISSILSLFSHFALSPDMPTLHSITATVYAYALNDQQALRYRK